MTTLSSSRSMSVCTIPQQSPKLCSSGCSWARGLTRCSRGWCLLGACMYFTEYYKARAFSLSSHWTNDTRKARLSSSRLGMKGSEINQWKVWLFLTSYHPKKAPEHSEIWLKSNRAWPYAMAKVINLLRKNLFHSTQETFLLLINELNYSK